jgi:hypothetical protein
VKKRLLFLGVIGLVLMLISTSMLMGAASKLTRYYMTQRDTLTVDAQYTATAWDSAAFIAAAGIDSACFGLTATFNVYLAPHDRLYIGFDDDTTAGAVTVPDMCTTIVAPTTTSRNPQWFPVTIRDFDMTVNGNTAVTDTFFLLFATGSSTSRVQIKDIKFDIVAVDSFF